AVFADNAAFLRVQAQLDLAARGIAGLCLPHAVVELDVVHVAVAGGGQARLDIGLAQLRHLVVGENLAGARIDRQVHALAVGTARVGGPDAVVELDVVDVGVALGLDLGADLGLGQDLAGVLGAGGARGGDQGHGQPRLAESDRTLHQLHSS